MRSSEISLVVVTEKNKADYRDAWHEILQGTDRFLSFGAWMPLDVGEVKDDWSRISFLAVREDHTIGVAWIDRRHVNDSCEIGLGLLSYARGKRYGTIVGRLLLRYSFEILGAHRVCSFAYSGNTASVRMQKGGMRREGVLRDAAKIGGRFYDKIWYGLLREEWEAQIKRRSQGSTSPAGAGQ